MSTIDPTATIAAAKLSATSASTTINKSAFEEGSETFMKLLVTNLKNQDPMSPQDPSAYMEQLSTMTMVEQLTTMAKSSKSQEALAMLGKEVSYTKPDGSVITGTVESVDTKGPTLTVGGETKIDPKSIISVTTTAPKAAVA